MTQDIDGLIARLEDRSNYQPSRNDMWQAAAALREQRDEIARLKTSLAESAVEAFSASEHAEKAETELRTHIQEVADLSAANDELVAERDAAMRVIEAGKAMRDAGVTVGQQVVQPDGMADDHALNEFIGLFDGPLQRTFDAALAKFEKEQRR